MTDLGPLIDKYGPNIKAEIDPQSLDALKVDGKLYAIPTTTLAFAGNSLYIRQDWLDKVMNESTDNHERAGRGAQGVQGQGSGRERR